MFKLTKLKLIPIILRRLTGMGHVVKCSILLFGSITLPAMGSANPLPSLGDFPQMPYLNWNPGPDYADEKRPFQGCPSLAVSENGRLWAFWLGGGVNEGPENYVMLSTSGDGGESWSDLQLVIDPPFRASEAGAWVDPQNRLWLFWNFHPLDLQRPGTQLWAMTAQNADDGKPQWETPRLLALEMVNINKPTVLSDGTWIIPTLSAQWVTLKAIKRPPSAPIGHLSRPLISDDNGKTFRVGGEIPVPDSMRNFDEYQVVEKKDGTLWMLNRTIPAPNGIGESFSTDGGQTWTPMQYAPIKHTASRIFFTRLSSGNLLLVKNGDLDDGSGRHRLTAFISMDEGKSWQGGLVLDERASSYPDGAQAVDGTIFIAYDHERTRAKEILLARFTEEDVMAGRLASPRSRLKLLINKAKGSVDHSSENFISEGLMIAQRAQQGSASAAVPVEPLRQGKSPTLDLHSFDSAPFQSGMKIYTNRAYSLKEAPGELEGRQMVVMPIEGATFHVLEGGMIYVASPSPARDPQSSLENVLIRQGFSKTDIPEFLAFSHPPGVSYDDSVRFTVYQRPVEAGEVISVGKLGLLIF